MQYPFNVTQMRVDDMVFWVAKSSVLNGCVGQGDTPDEAMAELAENENMWLETAREMEIPIPPVPVEQMTECSGKFTVRVAPHVHQTAAELAKKQGISLNQYINDAIVAQNASLLTTDYIRPAVTEAVEEISSLASSKIARLKEPFSVREYTGSSMHSESPSMRTRLTLSM